MMKRREFLLSAAGAGVAALSFSADALAGSRARAGAAGGGSDIIVGYTGPFTGPLAHYGISMAAGTNAVFKKVNEAGGIRGHRLRLVTGDDQFNPKKAQAAYQHCFDEGAVVFAGNFGTPTTAAALPWIAAHKIPVVGIYSGAGIFRHPVNPYIFHYRGSLQSEANNIRSFLDAQQNNRVMILSEQDKYGQACTTAMELAYGKSMAYLGSAYINTYGNMDDATKVAKAIMEKHPTALVLGMTTKIGALVVQALRKAGYGKKQELLIAISGIGPSGFAKAIPPKMRPGILVSTVVPFPYGGGTHAGFSAQFRADMKAAGVSEDVNFSGMEGYLNALVLTQALKQAKSFTPADITAALNGMGEFHIGTPPDDFRFDISPTNHSGTKYTNLVLMNEDGTYSN